MRPQHGTAVQCSVRGLQTTLLPPQAVLLRRLLCVLAGLGVTAAAALEAGGGVGGLGVTAAAALEAGGGVGAIRALQGKQWGSGGIVDVD